MCWALGWPQKHLEKKMSRGRSRPLDGEHSSKNISPTSEEAGEPPKVRRNSLSCTQLSEAALELWGRWGQSTAACSNGRWLCPWQQGWNQMTFKAPSNLNHSIILCKPARASCAHFNMPLCLPLKTTAQEMKTKKWACPDVIWRKMWPGKPWLIAVPGGSNSPEDWANDISKKEQQGGKRVRAVELWLQPPCKCLSQQAISLRNFRQNTSRIRLSSLYEHLQSAASTLHPAQTQPNTSKMHQHCNL